MNPNDLTRPSDHRYDHLVTPGPEFLAQEVGQLADPIIDGILQSEGIAIAAGDKGTGKSWLGVDMILSVAHGQAFLGHYPVRRTGRVLMIATEGSVTGWKARTRSQAAGKGIDPEHALDGVDVIFRKSVYVDDAQFSTWLTSRASAYVLIVV
jgi:AAA domain